MRLIGLAVVLALSLTLAPLAAPNPTIPLLLVALADQVIRIAVSDDKGKSDPVSLDTVWTTMTATKETGHARQAAEGHSSW
jgi:hypothetical protein